MFIGPILIKFDTHRPKRLIKLDIHKLKINQIRQSGRRDATLIFPRNPKVFLRYY